MLDQQTVRLAASEPCGAGAGAGAGVRSHLDWKDGCSRRGRMRVRLKRCTECAPCSRCTPGRTPSAPRPQSRTRLPDGRMKSTCTSARPGRQEDGGVFVDSGAWWVRERRGSLTDKCSPHGRRGRQGVPLRCDSAAVSGAECRGAEDGARTRIANARGGRFAHPPRVGQDGQPMHLGWLGREWCV